MARSSLLPITDHINLEYSVEGEGKPLLLLKGTGSVNNANYPFLIDALKKTYTVYTFNYPGFSKSSKMEWTDEQMVQLIDKFCTKFNLDKITLIGYSLGTYFAIKFALKFPLKVEKLILISPITSKMSKSLIRTSYGIIKENRILAKKQNKKSKPLSKGISLRQTYQLGKLFKYLKKIKVRDELHKISCPTYIFIGRQDKILNVVEEIENAKLIPGAKLKVYDDDGHYIIHNKAQDIVELTLH